MSDESLPPALLQPLVVLFSQGRFDQVIAQAQALTVQYPQAAQPYNLLGAAYAGLGQTEAALANYGKSIEADPAYAEAHSNLGATLFTLGRIEDATKALNTALAIKPDHPQATANLGAALCRLKQFEKASEILRHALQINPNNPEALGNLGVAYSALNLPEQAVELHRHAIALRPGHAADQNNLGSALAAIGQTEQALMAFRDGLSLDANHLDTLNNLGALLSQLDRTQDAVDCFQKALAIAQDSPHTHNNLGSTYLRAGQPEQAIKAFEAGLRHAPDTPELHDNKGLALYQLGQHAKATEAFETALRFDPDYAPAHANLATSLNDLGQRDAALAGFDKALSLRPDLADAHHRLARMKTFTPDDPQIKTLKDLLNQPHVKPVEQMHLRYALGTAMDAIGRFDAAFEHYAKANALRKQSLGYDPEMDDQLFALLKRSFAQSPACPAPTLGRPPKPIFIVGMPRSGTSLVEQILASHSQVFGGGEQGFLEQALARSGWTSGMPTQDMLTKTANTYRSSLKALNAEVPYITDKLPLNFRWLGFIAHAMPEAQIVHVKRDARATCWSIYTHFFATLGSRYAYDLQDIVGYYRHYSDLMAFWQKRLPGRIIEVDYDALTRDQSPQTRALLGAIGLPWQEHCLHPETTQRRITTASTHQVRQKVYTGSSERWRNYEPQLTQAFAALADL